MQSCDLTVCKVRMYFIECFCHAVSSGGVPKVVLQYGFGAPVEANIINQGDGKYSVRFVPPNEGTVSVLCVCACVGVHLYVLNINFVYKVLYTFVYVLYIIVYLCICTFSILCVWKKLVVYINWIL